VFRRDRTIAVGLFTVPTITFVVQTTGLVMR